MSTGYPFCDLLSICCHVFSPHVPPICVCFSLMLLIMSVTPLCSRIQFILFLSFRMTPIMIPSIFLWVVTNFSNWVLLSDQISQLYVITGSIHSLNALLFSLIGTFLSHMMLPSLPNALQPCPILIFISCPWLWSVVTICPRYTHLSTSSIFFPSTITSSLLTCLCYTLL